MRVFTIVFERLPMVWFLLGLLFNALGLYLGLEHPMAFVYLAIGWFCCAYGLALFVLRFQQGSTTSAATRLSANFISAGSTVMMPAMSTDEDDQAKKRSSTE